MRGKNKEGKAVGTAGRKRIQDLLAVLFFLLLLPYTCSLVSGIRQEEAVETSGSALRARDGLTLCLERENGVLQMPLEEFLVGALAACMPGEYREETLKAQAVILRSICRVKAEASGSTGAAGDWEAVDVGDVKAKEDSGAETGTIGGMDQRGPVEEDTADKAQSAASGFLYQEDSGLEYLDEAQRYTYWGTEWESIEEKFSKAVQETEGIVLAWKGEAVSPPFFRLSAGKTRDAAQIWGAEAIPWCKSVDCSHDIEAADFLQEKRLSWTDFLKTLGDAGMELPRGETRMRLTRDSAGYVTAVEGGAAWMAGERFRQLFALPSACFALEEENGEVIIRTKGVGHGLGFDQYGADLLAAEGADYMQLLDIFFEGLTLEKME